MIEIEFSEPQTSHCDCCGGVTTNLTRFVYQDGDAFAVYYAAFSDNHPERIVDIAIGLGEWGEGATEEKRVAFALKLRESESQYEVMVINADESSWQNAKFLGRMLNRETALAHPWIEDIFHITDHICQHDLVIKAYFGEEAF